MKWNQAFSQIGKILNPMPAIGGLAIDDTGIQLLFIRENEKITQHSLRLPAGIIEGGKVKDSRQLTTALRELHGQYAARNKRLLVVVSLPPSIVFTQSFAIPFLEGEKLDEAASLNLQMIAPLEFARMYSGWQVIGEEFKGGGQIEMLGAFAEKTIIDAFTDCLRAARFEVVAIEFPTLALARVIMRGVSDPQSSRFVINVGREGVTLILLKTGNLYFSRFYSWRAIQEEGGGRKIEEQAFEAFIIREAQKVANFYGSKWGGSIERAVIFPQEFSSRISKNIESTFGMKIDTFAIKQFPSLSSLWFPVLGSAFRGAIARGEDTFISLTDLPVKTRYEESRILNFISIWRKAIITLMSFILIIFGVASVFAMQQERFLRGQAFSGGDDKQLQEIQILQEQARSFNSLVAFVAQAKEHEVAWSKFFQKFFFLSGNSITVKRLTINNAGVVVTGTATNGAIFADLKEKLSHESAFKSINAPLSSVKTNPDDTVDFTLNFLLATKEF